MKRSIIMASLAFLPLLPMDETPTLKRAADTELVESRSAGEFVLAVEAVPAKKAKVAVNPDSLFEKCLSTLVKSLAQTEEDIICFVQRALSLKVPEDLCTALIDRYAKEQPAHKRNLARLELAAYCACKSITSLPSNPLIDLKKNEDGKANGFAVRALALVNELMADKTFEDKAQLQPLTYMWVPLVPAVKLRFVEGRFINFTKGYHLLRDYLLQHVNDDTLHHTLRQLICRGEEVACLSLMALTQGRHVMRLYELWRLAELFNRANVLNALNIAIEADLAANPDNISLTKLKTPLRFAIQSESCEDPHLSPYFERAVYQGDSEKLKDVKELVTVSVHDFSDSRCASVLNLAARLGYKKLVQTVLDKARLLLPGDRGRLTEGDVVETLCNAINHDQKGVVKLLLSRFSKISPDLDDLERAIDHDYVDTLRLVMPRFTSEGFGELLRKAFLQHSQNIITMLLEPIKPEEQVECVAASSLHTIFMGSNGDQKEKAKLVREALCMGVMNGELFLVQWLITRGVPLYGFIEDARLGALPIFYNPLHGLIQWMLLYKNAKSSNLAMVDLLLKSGATDEPDKNGKTVLMKLQEAAKDAVKQNPLVQENPLWLPFIEEMQKLLIDHANLKERPVCSFSKYAEGLVQYHITK